MKNQPPQFVCFGEVLWDILPGISLPGGAPMNVTYHLHKHMQLVRLITRIGNDKAGKDIRDLFEGRGLNTDYFSVDDEFETGKVYATPDEHNNMSYEIVQPVAWDYIPASDKNIRLVQGCDYLVYGSLAARSETSRNTLLKLLEQPCIKVMDINLRPPHFSKDSLLPLMQQADILKLNEDELQLVSGWFSISGNKKELIQQLASLFAISSVVVTLGAAGALLYHNDRFFEHKGYKVTVADTIGSGDAFLAGLLSKQAIHSSAAEMLDHACKLGAFIATKNGGCPEYALADLEAFTGE
jgi:fructokinase